MASKRVVRLWFIAIVVPVAFAMTGAGCDGEDEINAGDTTDDDDDIGDDDAATTTTTTTVAPTTSSTTVPTSTTGVTTTSSTTVPSTSTSTSLPTNTTTTTTAPTTTTSTTFASTSTTTVATTTSTTTTTIGEIVCYEDLDGDGHGDPDVEQIFSGGCPEDWAAVGDDCADADRFVHPGMPELAGDDVDQNCDGFDLVPSDDNGVFVSLAGNDSNPGTMAAPVRTVVHGIALAEVSERVVFLGTGAFDEYAWLQSTSLYGGYDDATWTRVPPYGVSRLQAVQCWSSAAVDGVHVSGGYNYSSYTDKRVGIWITPIGEADVVVANSVVTEIGASSSHYPSYAYGVLAFGGDVLLVRNVIHTISAFSTWSGASSFGVRADDPYGLSLTVIDNDIDGGWAVDGSVYSSSWSLGLAVRGGPVECVGNVIESGSSDHGFSLSLQEAEGSVIRWNVLTSVGSFGGANITFYNSGAVTMADNFVSGDFWGGHAANVAVSGSSLAALHNTFTLDGQYLLSATGVGVNAQSTARLVNNVLQFRGSDIVPVLLDIGGSAEVIHNVFDGGDGSVWIRDASDQDVTDEAAVDPCAWAGCDAAEGNLFGDPSLASPPLDLHIEAGSMCIDAGADPALWAPDLDLGLDIDGDIRPMGDAPDIGADEAE